MKLLLITILSCALAFAASPQKLALDTEITEGPITIQCTYVDLTAWGGIFRTVLPAFRCNMSTINPDAVAFAVTIRTQGPDGSINTYTQSRTAIQQSRSMVVFVTKDTVLLSVSVSEIKGPIVFGEPIPEV